MTWRKGFLISAVLLGLGEGFWCYGGGRTMIETFNFNVKASLVGLALVYLIPLLILPILLSAKKLWLPGREWPISSWLTIFAVCLLVGSMISEVCILWDEARFSGEVAQRNGNLYGRSRAWPNQGCSLVFMPGRGMHSTD
jgi:hypothetical protein